MKIELGSGKSVDFSDVEVVNLDLGLVLSKSEKPLVIDDEQVGPLEREMIDRSAGDVLQIAKRIFVPLHAIQTVRTDREVVELASGHSEDIEAANLGGVLETLTMLGRSNLFAPVGAA